DEASSAAILARAEGRIVRKPNVSLFDAVAAEGDELRFLAVIDRRGVADGTLRYAISIDPGDAVAGRDFDLPDESALSFEPGVTAKYFAIPTLANDASFEDRQLFLRIGVAGQSVVR